MITEEDWRWVDSLSTDPDQPSTIRIKMRDEVFIFDTSITVMPGEELIGFRVGNGFMFTGFVGFTLH